MIIQYEAIGRTPWELILRIWVSFDIWFFQVVPQAAQTQYESFFMVSYRVILKMAVIIKDLYGNLGNRFKEINSRWGFPIKKNTLL